MLLISTYQDLLIEIEVYAKRLEDLEREQYAIEKLSRSHNIDFHNQLERQLNLNNKYAIIQSILEDKLQTKKDILEKLNQLEGIEYKIAYKRFIENKTLNEIADELYISESWAKQKSAKVNKVLK